MNKEVKCEKKNHYKKLQASIKADLSDDGLSVEASGTGRGFVVLLTILTKKISESIKVDPNIVIELVSKAINELEE